MAAGQLGGGLGLRRTARLAIDIVAVGQGRESREWMRI